MSAREGFEHRSLAAAQYDLAAAAGVLVRHDVRLRRNDGRRV